ncbi:MAG: VOC family protein [Actinomycetota bacterium]|nr:VOC family protein [Actinomycetota bacterium]
MSVIHHSAICVRDVDASVRFWCDGLGFEKIMDHAFEGDWPTLLRAPSSTLRAVFLGDPTNPGTGVVELVDLGPVDDGLAEGADPATTGFLLLSVMTDLPAALGRLADLGLGAPRDGSRWLASTWPSWSTRPGSRSNSSTRRRRSTSRR